MIDETDSDLVADTEDEQFDAERDLIEYDQTDLDADDLYDTRHEAENIGAIALAARIEIERRNMIAHDGYRAKFGQHELLDIGMMLMSAKQRRFQTNESERVQRIQDLSSSFLTGFDLEVDDFDVEEVDQVPTTEVDDE